MERFALVRNESLESDKTFITKLFDSEDQDLGIDLDERRELIFIFVRSGKVLTLYTEEAGLMGYPESRDGLTDYLANKFLANLWELASKWPTESRVPYLVYSKVPANDETKAKIYQKCDDPELRKTIIAYCTPHEEFPETIGLAKKGLMTNFCEIQRTKHRGCLRIVRRQLGYTLAVHHPMDRREAQPDATSLCQKTARNPGILYRRGNSGRAPWAAGSGT
jgi:hypothetical protein